MRLSFAGSPEVRANVAAVWDRLLDAKFIASTAPAIESVEEIDPTHFKAVAALGIGALKLRFTMNVELFDLKEPESARMRIRGKAPGSTLDATTSFRLEPLGPKQVRLHWTADADVGGTVASVGARLLEGTARRLAEEFWQDFADQVSEQAA